MGNRGKNNNSYTAAFKLQVISYAQENGKRAAARKFEVHEKCVRNWCKQREELSATNASRRAFRGKKSQYPSIEAKIIDYIRDMRTVGCKVTQEMCRIKAVAFAEEEGIPLNQFKASSGWFQRMIRRNISSFENDYSEAKGYVYKSFYFSIGKLHVEHKSTFKRELKKKTSFLCSMRF